ncbi:MAG: hypothetical protein ACI8WB_004582 [Phenylobacterium sp.]
MEKGNIQGFNRYTYVNNNPYKYVDPDGRELVYLAVGAEKSKMQAIVTKVAKSNPVLQARFDKLNVSSNVHLIRQTEPGEAAANVPTGPKGSDSNDIGTGSMTAVNFSEKTLTIENGPNGSYGSFTSSTEAVVAHELLGHASQVDQGTINDSRNKIGLKKSEAYGIDTGNIYRAAKSEDLRKK